MLNVLVLLNLDAIWRRSFKFRPLSKATLGPPALALPQKFTRVCSQMCHPVLAHYSPPPIRHSPRADSGPSGLTWSVFPDLLRDTRQRTLKLRPNPRSVFRTSENSWFVWQKAVEFLQFGSDFSNFRAKSIRNRVGLDSAGFGRQKNCLDFFDLQQGWRDTFLRSVNH